MTTYGVTTSSSVLDCREPRSGRDPGHYGSGRRQAVRHQRSASSWPNSARKLSGPCSQVNARAVKRPQYTEPTICSVHKPQRMLPQLIGLLWLQPIDELVQITVVMRGCHPFSGNSATT